LVLSLLVPVVVLVVVTGAALVQPPKSSSEATVGVALEELLLDDTPQPPPMSLAVSISGTFIVLEIDGDTAGRVVLADGDVGAGSGVLQALPPHGSIAEDENMLVTVDVDVVAVVLGAGLDVLDDVIDDERLKTEFTFVEDGGDAGLGGGGDIDVVVVTDGDTRSNRSFLAEGAGGFDLDAGVVVVPG
jgi:hypothetical protein